MNASIAQAALSALEADAKRCSAALNSIPGVGAGSMGLTPDHVKRSTEFVSAKADYERAAAAVRKFSKSLSPKLQKEMHQQRMKARLAKLASA